MSLRATTARLVSKVPRGVHLGGAGAVPGKRLNGKSSTEMTCRSESMINDIRIPIRSRWPIRRWKIVRGDTVEVISGEYEGRRGRVLEVVRPSNSVVVEGVNLVDTDKEKRLGSEAEKKFATEAPIHVSDVMIVCPQTLQKSKIGFAFLADGTKVRIAKRSGAIIPRPEILTKRRKPLPTGDGPKDTPAEVVSKVTYKDEAGLYEKYESFAKVIERSGIM